MRQTRRAFIRTIGLGAAAMAMAARGTGAAERPSRRPNILIILTDDQGWGDVRSHGNEQLSTPHLDSLAAEGARFDHFFVSPVCAPTRASLLTGRYHMRTGVSGVTHRKETMRSEEVTIAELLRDAGYATGCFGKWHNGAHYPHHPNGQGFDEFLGFCAGHWNDYFDADLEHNGQPCQSKGYINDVFTDAAIEFMTRNRERPFLCYVPFNTPHAPFQVPDRYFDRFKVRGFDDALASVYGMCESLDDCVGRMMTTLDELGIADDTIVVFFGDNGPNTERYNGGMLGRKGSVHEGGVRNAFFMRYPRRIATGTQVSQIAAHIDLLPTFAELAGVPIDDTLPLDGRSLVPLLEGNAVDWPDRMLFFHWAGRGSVRTQQYRMFTQKGDVALYDMTEDPGQKNNIVSQRPEVAKKLKDAYDAWYADVTKDGLEPPSTQVGHREMPVVDLYAPEVAQLAGGLAFMGEKGWANDWITGWASTECEAAWEIDVVRQGTYAITLMYTCPSADVGARMCVEVGGQRLEATVEEAHDPKPLPTQDRVPRWEVYEKEWAPLPLGTVTLPEGETLLRVRALEVPGGAAIDLKSVRVLLIGA